MCCCGLLQSFASPVHVPLSSCCTVLSVTCCTGSHLNRFLQVPVCDLVHRYRSIRMLDPTEWLHNTAGCTAQLAHREATPLYTACPEAQRLLCRSCRPHAVAWLGVYRAQPSCSVHVVLFVCVVMWGGRSFGLHTPNVCSAGPLRLPLHAVMWLYTKHVDHPVKQYQ